MDKYVGIKIVEAKRMMAKEAKEKGALRDNNIPNAADGYLVVYENGYESWSPKEVFEKAYHHVDSETLEGLTFAEAWLKLQSGMLIRKKCWDEGIYLYLVIGSNFKVNRPPLNEILPEGTEVSYDPHVDMIKLENGVCKAKTYELSVCEMLTNDWEAYPKSKVLE